MIVAPGRDCPDCPRLVEFQHRNRAAFPDFHNAPVPSFGGEEARLLIVGLAPGLKGANRTGRPFTGDYAGDLLYATLIEYGFGTGTYAAHPEDGFTPKGCRIVNAVRCVPPENKPTPAEIKTCNKFLGSELAGLPKLGAILALGRIAHDATLRALGHKLSRFAFSHGAEHDLGDGRMLYDSYHCSRYNTNTGVLTPEMFRAVFARIAATLRA